MKNFNAPDSIYYDYCVNSVKNIGNPGTLHMCNDLDHFILNNFYDAWDQPHRHYHTVANHLTLLLNDIVDFGTKYNLEKRDMKALVYTAFMHDWFYDPRRNDNEEKCAELWKSLTYQLTDDIELYDLVYQMILDTKEHKPTVKLSGLFCDMDKNILNSSFIDLLEYEKQIWKEYEFVDWMTYKTKRIEFLKAQENINLVDLIEYLENYEPKIGLYAGSFNPMHVGHLDILHKAEKLFDKVIIAKGQNPEKNVNDEEYQASLRHLKSVLPNEIIGYSGLLTDLIENMEESGQDVTLIRGIRNGFDLVAENKMIEYMKEMYYREFKAQKEAMKFSSSGGMSGISGPPLELKVIYIPCDREFDHISSSDIRNLKRYGDDIVKKYLV